MRRLMRPERAKPFFANKLAVQMCCLLDVVKQARGNASESASGEISAEIF